MISTMAGTVLTRDLVAAEGSTVATRGDVIDLAMLRDMAAGAPRNLTQLPLHQSSIGDSVLEALEAPQLEHVCGTGALRGQLADVVAEIRFPEPIWRELEALKQEDPLRLQHGVWTALVAARMFGSALGQAPGLLRLVGGALVHDVGMRHAAPRLRHKREHLTRAEALALENHPLLGALLLARFLGDVPAVHFALLHHTRAGQGYPKVTGSTPLRGLDVVAVASAFAAMVSPRTFRPAAFNARGSADQLLDEAHRGAFDPRAVRLLIHCLRGGRGTLAELNISRRATGYRPSENRHGLVPIEARTGT